MNRQLIDYVITELLERGAITVTGVDPVSISVWPEKVYPPTLMNVGKSMVPHLRTIDDKERLVKLVTFITPKLPKRDQTDDLVATGAMNQKMDGVVLLTTQTMYRGQKQIINVNVLSFAVENKDRAELLCGYLKWLKVDTNPMLLLFLDPEVTSTQNEMEGLGVQVKSIVSRKDIIRVAKMMRADKCNTCGEPVGFTVTVNRPAGSEEAVCYAETLEQASDLIKETAEELCRDEGREVVSALVLTPAEKPCEDGKLGFERKSRFEDLDTVAQVSLSGDVTVGSRTACICE